MNQQRHHQTLSVGYKLPHFTPSSHFAFCIVLVALAVFGLAPQPAYAKYASLVLDADTGQVLHEVNADTRNYPASLTKMMTLYLMFEAIDERRMRLDDRILISRHAARQPPSKLGIRAGRTISVENAIRALAIKSANDIAAAVAEHMAGSERQFALLMTAKARSLGMSNTTFRNASGLMHRSQLSSARDMATMARAMLLHFPHKYGYFSEKQFSYAGKVYKTHNKLLLNYEGTDGIKTGYIRASGFNLVASVKRGNKRLIGVVFGAKNSKIRNRHMVSLLEKGWAKIAPQYALASTQKARAAKAATQTLNVRKVRVAYRQNPKRKKPKLQKRGLHRRRTLSKILSGSSRWGVQVGAYKTYDPAYAVAVRAIGLAPSYLASGNIAVIPLHKKNGHVLYRGRILGITKRQAYRACRFLKHKRFGCMPLKISSTVEVASIK
ncbi:MAG: D-alanyl-D-alanine carboxypeptidase [Magnetovibrio sp.]|nr:D-alanyl-D-alanine carboxypeptidase [Magnetovibrio sp.]